MTVIDLRPRLAATSCADSIDSAADRSSAPQVGPEEGAVPAGIPVESIDTKATATYMRRALRAAFPGVRFSVTCSRGSSYGWISITYEDGPRVRDVDALVDIYEGSAFSGMDDCYHRRPPVHTTLPGHDTPGLYSFACRGISITRHMGARGALAVAAHINHTQPGAVHAEGTTVHGEITEATREALEVAAPCHRLEGVAWEVFCRLTIPA